jgi:branched-chain amino acid aminotransferase
MSVVWFNGDFELGTLPLDANDRGLLLGDGVFETIAVLKGQPKWLVEHIDRMESSAAELGIAFERQSVLSGIVDVLQKTAHDSEVLRVTLSRGKTTRGLSGVGANPSLLITLSSFAPEPMQPCRLKISAIRRNEYAPSSRLKTLSYIDGIMAAREVAGEADDALMLNTAGNVASATIGNIFMVKDNALITPSLDQGILPGITRQKFLDLPSLQGVERAIKPDELYNADAVFMCNSLRPLRPISHLNGTALNLQSLENLWYEITTLTSKG